MKMNRKHMMIGAASLGLAGALATGGVALAASGPTGTGTPSSSAAESDFGCGLMAGFGDMRGGAFGDAPMLTTAAQYFAMSQTDLRTQLQTGKSLAQVAQAQGKSVTGLEDAIVAAVRARVEANTALSADQRTAILAQVQSRVAAMVTTAHPAGAGSAGQGGMWGDGDTHRMGGMHGMGGW